MTAFERYEKGKMYFSGIEKDIISDIEKSKFKKSLKCLYKNAKVIEFIKDGIVSVGLNIYASQVLHRSLIEHYLLSLYIFLRCKIENSDTVGEEYYGQYSQSETLKQATYSLQLADIRNNIKRVIDISVLKKEYPYFVNISQKNMEEFHRIANQFSNVKVIGNYLLKNKDFEAKLEPVNQRTFDLLEKYSYFSSFVHGGPHAQETMFAEADLDFATVLELNTGWAYTLAHISKINLVLLLRGEFYEKYKEHFTKMFTE